MGKSFSNADVKANSGFSLKISYTLPKTASSTPPPNILSHLQITIRAYYKPTKSENNIISMTDVSTAPIAIKSNGFVVYQLDVRSLFNSGKSETGYGNLRIFSNQPSIQTGVEMIIIPRANFPGVYPISPPVTRIISPWARTYNTHCSDCLSLDAEYSDIKDCSDWSICAASKIQNNNPYNSNSFNPDTSSNELIYNKIYVNNNPNIDDYVKNYYCDINNPSTDDFYNYLIVVVTQNDISAFSLQIDFQDVCRPGQVCAIEFLVSGLTMAIGVIIIIISFLCAKNITKKNELNPQWKAISDKVVPNTKICNLAIHIFALLGVVGLSIIPGYSWWSLAPFLIWITFVWAQIVLSSTTNLILCVVSVIQAVISLGCCFIVIMAHALGNGESEAYIVKYFSAGITHTHTHTHTLSLSLYPSFSRSLSQAYIVK